MRRVETRRGAVFLLCELSTTDPRFARYPPLPVLQCAGFTPTAPPHGDPTRDS